MTATQCAEHEPRRHDPATILREEVNTFSQAASSQRKRKRGVSETTRTGDETISARLDINDLDVIVGNSRLRNHLKGLVDDTGAEASSASKHQKLSAPTPHTLQVRLNRQEAYSTTKQTLNKWLDAVKSNRNAEQLIFPLGGKPSDQIRGVQAEPTSKLEDRISRTLSLPVQNNHKDKAAPDCGDPAKPSSKRTKARTAHLRMERELLLRKEAKAKRLRKIKSKSYRRLLRKDQQKAAKQLLPSENADVDDTEDGLEAGEGSHSEDDQVLDEKLPLTLQNKKVSSGQRLFAMKFMEEAEKRSALRDQTLEAPGSDVNPLGRRIFHDGLLASRARHTESTIAINQSERLLHTSPATFLDPKPIQSTENTNPWLCHQPVNEEIPPSKLLKPLKIERQPSTSARDISNRQTATSASASLVPHSSIPMSSITQESIHTSLVPSSQPPDIPRNEQPELLARAFAGDNILPEIAEEREKQAGPLEPGASGLRGWGAWGASLGDTTKARRQKKATQQQTKNKKVRTDKVIMGQKLCKKGMKYLATNIPYPFETSDQYERSLRFPIGQEWSTKQTHQTLTAPKVIVKGGTVIAPLS
ncbi:hypothetical protein TWF730_004640 [Orbilia blumenaviensis]|uniref:Uncharacterized protein n=1 Tax=Orbilia blumenaviensis TaxID=1796055 RepID=A0AAV9TWT8_9PEZI